MTNAELLARFKLLASRPSTDELLTDPQIYLLLTDGQQRVTEEIAVHVPSLLYTTPVKMTTSDNIVYTAPSSGKIVGALEVYGSSTAQEPLVAGAYWDDTADYTIEGESTIRMIGNRARVFADGPYIRYVKESSTIDGSTQPTLLPVAAHLAIVYDALIQYASISGVVADPSVWQARKREVLWGTGEAGSIGVIPALKMQVRATGPGPSRWYTRFLA